MQRIPAVPTPYSPAPPPIRRPTAEDLKGERRVGHVAEREIEDEDGRCFEKSLT
jgi:hypothetical protein